MQKLFTFFAIILMAGATAWAEKPATTNENNPSNDPVFQLRMDNLAQSMNLLNYEPSFQLNETTSFGVNSFNDFSALTRRKRNQTAKILTFVGAGCVVVGGTAAILCYLQTINTGNKILSENGLTTGNAEESLNNLKKGANNMVGWWAGAIAGTTVFTAGGVLTTIGIIKWVKGSKRHSELLNVGVESDLCADPHARESMLSFGVGNGTMGFALEF